jgi:hypothetical protein
MGGHKLNSQRKSIYATANFHDGGGVAFGKLEVGVHSSGTLDEEGYRPVLR